MQDSEVDNFEFENNLFKFKRIIEFQLCNIRLFHSHSLVWNDSYHNIGSSSSTKNEILTQGGSQTSLTFTTQNIPYPYPYQWLSIAPLFLLVLHRPTKKKWNELNMWVYYPYGFWAAESEPGFRISPGPPSFPLA